LANPTFISQLDKLRPSVLNSEGHPIMEEQFVQTLKDGVALNLFTTLRQQLVGKDLGKFEQPDDTEMKQFLRFLTNTHFASLAAEQSDYTRLGNKVAAVLLNGNLTSAITLPFLNVPIDLSGFASSAAF
jgi:hypothetical protein